MAATPTVILNDDIKELRSDIREEVRRLGITQAESRDHQ
jgi:hypothetical protein